MAEQLASSLTDPSLMAGNVAPADQEAARLMDDLYLVGPRKPLGYLPVSTITGVCHQDIRAVRDRCEGRGLLTYQGGEKETQVGGGALYAYDHTALGELLDVNRALLGRYGWPTDPLEFIKSLGQFVDAHYDPALFTLIAWAYNDPRPEYRRPDFGAEEDQLQQPKVPFDT